MRRYKLWEDCQYCSKGDRDRPYQTFPSIFIIGSECSPVAIVGSIGVAIHQGWEFAHSLIFGERPERIVYKTYEKYDFSQIVLSELLIYHERPERNAHLS